MDLRNTGIFRADFHPGSRSFAESVVSEHKAISHCWFNVSRAWCGGVKMIVYHNVKARVKCVPVSSNCNARVQTLSLWSQLIMLDEESQLIF